MSYTSPHKVSFEDTEAAFAYKSDSELRKARFLFGAMGSTAILKIGLALTPWAIKFKIPFTHAVLRNTLFKQFVGGETLEQTASVAGKLNAYKVDVILDYGVEGGSSESSFEASTHEFIKVIDYAATVSNIPFMSIKVTGIARFGLLEKINTAMHDMNADTLMKNYTASLQTLTEEEQEEWRKVVQRFHRICDAAERKNVGVLVDAEESWIQAPVDAITILMMEGFNKNKCVVYNTIQLYRHDRLDFLKKSHVAATERNFIMGAKLVRGAYMEKERARAATMGYPSPIQPDKESTDRDYDLAVGYCLQHLDRVGLIVASHNEHSNALATSSMLEKGYPSHHPHMHFSQLYGMSDNITFNLAAHGFGVSKYLPFGPISDVVPYLMRRAQENSSVAGQTGRELLLIEKELKRRK